MRVLGFDPSLTAFGWALHDTVALGHDRCLDRGRFCTTSKQVYVDRFASHRKDVRRLIERLNPDKIGIESPSYDSYESVALNALFIQVCESIKRCKKDVVYLAPLQVKIPPKILLGRPKGWKMEKIDMIEAARLHVSVPHKSSGRWSGDEADAYWVAVLSSRFWLFEEGFIKDSDLLPHETEMFAKTHTYVRGKKKGLTERSGLLYKKEDRYHLWSET